MNRGVQYSVQLDRSSAGNLIVFNCSTDVCLRYDYDHKQQQPIHTKGETNKSIQKIQQFLENNTNEQMLEQCKRTKLIYNFSES